MNDSVKALIGPGSPFELEALADGRRIFRHAPRTLREFYARIGKRSQDAIALVMEDRCISLGVLFTAARTVATLCGRQRQSARQPQRVALVFPNGPEFAAGLIGVTDVGAVAVLVPFEADVERMARYVAAADCDLVLTTTKLATNLAGQVTCTCLPLSWIKLTASVADPGIYADITPESEALIAFTSGSSGTPKAAIISHRALLTGLWNMMLAGAWTARRNRQLEGGPSAARPGGSPPCSLVAGPLTHVSGYTHLLLSLNTSARIVLLSRWEAALAAELACREQVKSLAGATPRMIRELLGVPLSEGRELTIESFGVHGSALRGGLMREIRERLPGARFSTGYGLTEASGSIAVTAGAELMARPDSCGPVLPTVDIEVVDAEGRVLPTGEAGEIHLCGAMLFSGYLGEESGTKPDKSWFVTGDIGVLGEDGFLTLLERGADAVMVGTRDVYCAEIEKYLDAERCGQEVIAVGTMGGRHLLLGVVSKRADLDVEALRHKIQRAFSIPAEDITVVCEPDFPRTSSGKINRHALTELVREGAA